eukprot:SAG22_NODE_3491_length_1683_cov_1.743687_1_plen_237_part_10
MCTRPKSTEKYRKLRDGTGECTPAAWWLPAERNAPSAVVAVLSPPRPPPPPALVAHAVFGLGRVRAGLQRVPAAVLHAAGPDPRRRSALSPVFVPLGQLPPVDAAAGRRQLLRLDRVVKKRLPRPREAQPATDMDRESCGQGPRWHMIPWPAAVHVYRIRVVAARSGRRRRPVARRPPPPPPATATAAAGRRGLRRSRPLRAHALTVAVARQRGPRLPWLLRRAAPRDVWTARPALG